MDTNISSIEFQKIETVVLLGGGIILKELTKIILDSNKTLKVITSPRQFSENIGQGSLKNYLELQKIDFSVIEKLTKEDLLINLGSLDKAFSISIGAPWIFDEEIISKVFHNRLVNLHGTRLPQNRGGGGFSWQILTGNRFGFLTLHLIDGGIDTGPIIDQRQFLYPATCRIPEDYNRVYIDRVIKYFYEFFSIIFSNKITLDLKSQNEALSTYWPRLNSDTHSWIDWSLNPIDLERFICAFDSPYAGSKTTLNGAEVKLKSVSVNYQDGLFHPYQRGIIYRVNPEWICVALNGCSLIIEQVLNNTNENIIKNIKIGDRFHTPHEKIENSLSTRVKYTPNKINQFKTLKD